MHPIRRRQTFRIALAIAVCWGAAGCRSTHVQTADWSVLSDIPRELDMAMLPTYRVGPPDILLIDAVNNIRPPETKLRAGDMLFVRLANPEPLAPIDPTLTPIEAQLRAEMDAQFKIVNGEFRIQPRGTLDLGPVYGSVHVAGLTIEQAQAAVRSHLESYIVTPTGERVGLVDPQVEVTWPDLAGRQAIFGEHLVRPDGSVSLGIYGAVSVAGMTLGEVKQAVETHLSAFIHEPEINVDVLAYNSKVYYVVVDGGGFGEQIHRLPVTGNETVLDAIGAIQGLSQVSSKKIWVARPAPPGTSVAQTMPVNWHDITAEGVTDTNYQLMPGDRIYVQADKLIAIDNFIAKALAPVERIAGFTLLGTAVVRNFRFFHLGPRGGFGGGFGGF